MYTLQKLNIKIVEVDKFKKLSNSGLMNTTKSFIRSKKIHRK